MGSGARDRTLEYFGTLGIAKAHMVRVLVCDGPALLYWVGAARDEAFTTDEVRWFQQLVPDLQRRLALEQKVDQAHWALPAMDVVLERLGQSAFVYDSRGRQVYANEAGRAWLHQEGRSGAAMLADALRARHSSTRVEWTSLSSGPSGPHYHLLVVRPESAIDAKLALAAKNWGLTRRQGEVLALVARGQANRSIALALNCAVGTIEVHVHALLSKAGCASRSTLIATALGEAYQ
jgi:DNA-binding CsgD family transcriptional regulator